MASSSTFACRWDWCRSTFPALDALETHVKHEHIWPMNPMRKTEIALMRRLDLASLHSSQNTDSDIISRGILDRLKTPPAPLLESTSPENESFNTLSQLSSPPQTHSPQSLPVSPAFESLVKQDGPSRLSAALKIFERNHGHKPNQHVRSPSHQRSPAHRPPTPVSHCSHASQEAVEQQLTQEDDVPSQPPIPSNLQIDHEPDVELVWPPLAEDEAARPEIPSTEQPTPDQGFRLGSSPSPSRGKGFRCGSLNVSLDSSQSSADSLEESDISSQPFVLQTQAPYSSQAMVWSQSQ